MKKEAKTNDYSVPTFSVSDQHLWEQVTKTVNPLYSKKIGERQSYFDSTTLQKRKRLDKVKPWDAVSINNRKVSNLSYLCHGMAPGLDKRTFQKLLRGKLRIERTLDLHGYTAEEAKHQLNNFIHECYSRGSRCTLIITGKGVRGNLGVFGVLKRSVPEWLNSQHLRPMILAFIHARQDHGGTGALYVLLKRKR